MAETSSELQTEIEKLEARHAEHPEGRFFVPLANAYRKTGEIDRAVAVLREGLRRHPDYLSAHIVLGRCLADSGATSEAVGEFQHVLTIDPQNLIALRTLGELAMSAGRRDDSARWYEQLLAVDPMNEEARRALDAIPDMETESAGMEPQDVEAPAAESPSMGAASVPEGGATDGFGEPVVDLDLEREGMGQDPAGEVVTETIAELYARQGLLDRAVEVYRELIRRRGGDPALERRLAELTAPPAPPSGIEAAPGPDAIATPEPIDSAPEISDSAPMQPFSAGAEESSPEPEPFDDPLPVLGEDGALPEAFADDSPLDADPFAASFEYGFLDEPGEPPSQAQPESAPEWEPAADEASLRSVEPEHARAAARVTIAEYLSDLAAWRPGAPAVQPEGAGEIELPEPVGPLAADLFEEQPTPIAELAEEPELDDSAPWLTRGSFVEPEAASAAPAVEPVEDETLFPWESPAEPEAAPAAAESAPEDEPFPFESFFEQATAPAPAPQEPTPPASAPTAPQEAAPAQEDEDDLESFQAWLRSLKR